MRIEVSSWDRALYRHRLFFAGQKLDGEHVRSRPPSRLARIHARATSCVQIQFGIELHGRMITDVNNSVIMTSTVAGYANKARRGEIKGVEPGGKGRRGRREGDADRCIAFVVKYEKIKRRTGYDGDPRIVMIEKIRTPLDRRPKGEESRRGGRAEDGEPWKKNALSRRTHFLPYEDVVDHGASAEHDAEADEDRRDDRRGRMELDERVQDHAWESGIENSGLTLR